MPCRANERYEAVVTAAETTENEKTHNAAVTITFSTSDGEITRDFYLTAAAAPHTGRVLKTLGASDAQLADEDFFPNVGQVLTGAKCSITTIETKGNDGKSYVEVQWVNGSKPRADKAACAKAASLFRKEPPATDSTGDDWTAGATPPPEKGGAW